MPAVLRGGLAALRLLPPILFSLDLAEGTSARIKIYFRHYQTDAAGMARLLAEYPGFTQEETVHYCRILNGDAADFAQAPVTYLSFDGRDGTLRDATLYLPLWRCAPDDEVVRQRVHQLLSRRGCSTARYDSALASVAGRPLAAGAGIHSYISWRPGLGRSRFKVYWSPELLQRDPPPRYQQTTTGSLPPPVRT